MKLEVLCQVAPAIFLGLHIKSLHGRSILSGLAIGICVTLFIMFSKNIGIPITPKPWGIHAGVWGLAANFSTVGLFQFAKDQLWCVELQKQIMYIVFNLIIVNLSYRNK